MNEHPISDDERARRQKAIDFARTNIELSGFALSPGMAALGVRFVAGELSESEYIAAALAHANRSEEHTSELQSLMRISYAVFCLKKKKKKTNITNTHETS